MRFLRLTRTNGEHVLINPAAIAYAEENHHQTYNGKPSTYLNLMGVEDSDGERRRTTYIWVKETFDEIENILSGYRLLGGYEVRNGDEL